MDSITNKKHNIFYNPDISYDTSYETEGYISEVQQDEYESNEGKIDKIKEHVKDIDDKISVLPEDIQELIKNPYEAVKVVIGDIGEADRPDDTSGQTIAIGNADGADIGSIANPFDREPDPFVITPNKTSPDETVKKEYDYDMASIIEDYLNELSIAVEDYLNNALTVLSTADHSSYQKLMLTYTGNTADVSDDYKHLSDMIIRSQISRKMKMKYYNKMFTLDKTISHIRVCKVCIEQRKRYYSAKYIEESTLNDLLSNRMLENSRMMYDRRYKNNFTNLYKYLNSSVIVLRECLKACINEIQAKTILLEKEGEIW